VRIPWAQPAFGAEEEREVLEVLRSGRVSMGAKVAAFEGGVAELLGVAHAVATTTGTAALDVALKALGIRPGDEVIIPALTYVATAHAVAYQGAVPVLADVDEETLNVDPDAVHAALGPRTRCVVSIDYGGAAAKYPELEAICARHGIPLLVDAAHSLGGSLGGRPLGSFGTAATLSFHIAKVLTTIEGGMVVTDDPQIADAARTLRNQGERPGQKYVFDAVGSNYRLPDLQAAIGVAQLAKLPDQLARRRRIAGWYRAELEDVAGVRLPRERPGTVHPWFLFSVRMDSATSRDRVADALARAGVETRICWPHPIHQQPAYRERLANSGPHPHAEAAAQRVLTLPIHTALDQSDVRLISDVVPETLAGTR